MSPPPDDLALMTGFVKLLGDRGRLAIIGLLAARPRTLDELAEDLATASRATLTRNLKLLEDAEWISSDGNGTYRLRPDALTTLRAAMARVEILSGAMSDSDAPATTAPAPRQNPQPMLAAYFDDQGRLRRMPAQRRQKELVLRHVGEQLFTMGRSYDEKEVNELLEPLYKDVDAIREDLVEVGVMERRNGRYWISLRK
ncbi:MAG: DUF2087 domain-containing protein [Armatimonadetes bacterium]|nr:DUF2087 domain-containing protein [Armatimonadota bacterium]